MSTLPLLTQILFTAVIAWILLQGFITATRASDLPTWVMLLVLILWAVSGIASVSLALYLIWT